MRHARAIAAAQTVPVRWEVDANVERHLRLVREAAKLGVEVLVFPELSLTGYELDLAGELAFSESDARLGVLVGAARSARMTLVVGAPARLGARLHIGAFILSPDGSIELYTKRRLGAFPASASPDGVAPPAEASVFEPGDRNPLVPCGEGTAAIAVCADTGDAEHAREAAARGSTTYLASLFVIPADLEKERATLRGYAVRHAMAVACANYGGPSGGLPAAGRSAIWSERGELLAQLGESGAGLAVALESAAGWRAMTISLRNA